jgi:putative hemolysin
MLPILTKTDNKNIFSQLLNPYRTALRKFTPKVSFKIERSKFIIKTAENGFELEKAMRLRHEVFYREILNKWHILGIDVDKYDFFCDHLLIIDKNTDTIIGTYRLNSSLFSDVFYSETEFNIDSIKAMKDVKLEMGRACTHKDHRNGITIMLLWKGIMEYVKQTRTKYIFGCSSVQTSDFNAINSVFNYLKTNYYSSDKLRVFPKKNYSIKSVYHTSANTPSTLTNAPIETVPPLLMSYLKTGASICGEPAYDRAFKCADFLTLLDLANLNKSVERKYSNADNNPVC